MNALKALESKSHLALFLRVQLSQTNDAVGKDKSHFLATLHRV
ncbi:hypothetical protein ONV78_30400 [Hahella sp. CR1]|nr:hypothetical protein [Hahella sp. CR1]MDG9672084.1 hypothetical protein [Hahella sp. CR1]